MFSAVSIAELRIIADLAAAVSRDERAMQEYLYPGSTAPGSFRPTFASEIDRDARAGRFDSAERAQLEEFLLTLSPDARHEVIAVIDIGRDVVSSLDDGRTEARSMSEDYQIKYIQNRTSLYLSKGLTTLGVTL